MNNSKVAIAVSKTLSFVQMFIGIVILFVFGVCTIMELTDTEAWAQTGISFFIFCLVCDALGIWLIILSRKKSKLIKEFKKYVAVVSSEPTGYIPDIAASLGVSEEVVKSNFEKMIQKKYFANAFIDLNSNCIVIVNKKNTEEHTEAPSQEGTTSTNHHSTPTTSQNVEMVTVKCKSCGGINTVQKGTVRECDYCGSSIKGE